MQQSGRCIGGVTMKHDILLHSYARLLTQDPAVGRCKEIVRGNLTM